METVIVKWFRDVVSNGLCIQPQVFDDFMKSRGQILTNFVNIALSASQISDYTIKDKVLTFYCSQQEEEIDVETESSYDEVEDEEDDVEGISLAESDDSDEEIVTLKTGTPVSSYEEDLASTYISYATTTGQDLSEIASSPYEEEEESSEEKAPIEDLKKKIIKQLIMKTVLYASLNDFPKDVVEKNVMYFIALDKPSEPITTEIDLVNYFEFGVLNGEGLLSLQKLMTLVYGALIDKIKPFVHSENSLTEDESLLESTRFNIREFKKYLNKIPTCYPTCSEELYDIVKCDLSEDYDLKQWQEMIDGWNSKLTNTIEVLTQLNPKMDNFEELVSFWKAQFEETNYLLEQLGNTALQMTLKKLKLEGITEEIEEFERLAFEIEGIVEKREQTVNILLILKQILDGCKVTEKYHNTAMIASIENIRLIWTISREYNNIENFGHLFKVVNLFISQQVLTILDFKNIPNTSSQKILKNITSGIDFLHCWKKALSLSKDTRNVESSIPDLTNIFPILPTDHVLRVLEDLASFLLLAINVIQTSGDVNLVKGNEAKLMESRNELLKPIFDLEYDIFDLYYKDTWEKNFRKINNQLNNVKLGLGKSIIVVPENEDLEKLLLVVQRLRADSLSFKGDETGEYIGLMNSFVNEVSYLQNLVKNQPIDYFSRKNLPDLTSYLYWLHGIVNLIEISRNQLLKSKDVLNSPKWSDVKSHTENVLSNLNTLKSDRFIQWQKLAEANLPKVFNQNLFIQFERANIDISISRDSTLLKEVILNQNKFIQVNYPAQLKEIMFQAKSLRNLGFSLSESLQTVVLLEREVLCFENELREVLRRYSEMISYFPNEKAEIVQPIFKGIDHVIKMGCKNMTWASISIPDYIEELNTVVVSTSVVVEKTQKVMLDLENSRSAFNTTNLVRNNCSRAFPIYKTIEERRVENQLIIEHLLKNYKSVSYSLIKLENLIHKSETGCCKELKSFYYHWEEIILKELLQMVKTNLSNFLTMISSSKDFFEIKLVLKNKELSFDPGLSDILRSVLFTVVDIVKSTENFSRWLNGMCITAQEMSDENIGDISTRFSFYSDVSQDAQIISICKTIESTLCTNLDSIEQSVQKLDMFKFLWALDAASKCQQFSKNASKSAYYKNFRFFVSLKNKLAEMKPNQQFGCLTLSLDNFLKETKSLVNKWIRELGFVLYDGVEINISALYSQLKEIHKNLNIVGDTEDNLKIITETIKTVSGMIGKIDTALKDYEEKLQVLSQFKIGVNKESMTKLRKVYDLWQQILKSCKILSSVLFIG